jgi:hypothetical protein
MQHIEVVLKFVFKRSNELSVEKSNLHRVVHSCVQTLAREVRDAIKNIALDFMYTKVYAGSILVVIWYSDSMPSEFLV